MHSYRNRLSHAALILSGMLTLGVAGLLASACGSDVSAFPACAAGQSEACVGPMGCSGFQVCADDGSKFGACDCGVGNGGSGSGGGGMGSSTTSASGGNGSGGTGSSTSASSGTGGDPGSGGGGNPNPAGCPPQEPQDNGVCTGGSVMGPLVCDYGDTSCSCGFNNNWNCYSCPAQVPQGGCTDFGAQCSYGDTSCSCFGGQWGCVTCPQDPPTGPCNSQGNVCTYGLQTCACFQGNWNCF